MFKKLFKYTFATDIVTILYIVVSSIFILNSYSEIPTAGYHIIARIWMLIILIQIIFLQKNYATPFMEFFHILLPFFYIIYFYFEAPSLNLLHLTDWAQDTLNNLDIKVLGNSLSAITYTLRANYMLVQISYLIQLIVYASVPTLVFIAFAKKNTIGKRYAYISLTSLLIFVFIMQLFPTNINNGNNSYTGIIGGIYELFQIIIYNTTVSTLNILVGFLIVSSLFFITINKKITLILNLLWILSSIAGIILSQQFFIGTLITWILAPLVYLILHTSYASMEKHGIS